MTICEMCDRQVPNLFLRARADWDWFHGYLPRTVYFCPQHKTNELRNRLWKISRRNPDSLSGEDQNIVGELQCMRIAPSESDGEKT